MKKIVTLILNVLVLASVPMTWSQTHLVTLNPTQDAYLDEANPNANYGSELALFVGPQGSAGSNMDLVSLIQFDIGEDDIPGIPAGANLTGASLNLYLFLERSALPSAYRMNPLQSWQENTITWNIGFAGDMGVTGSLIGSSPDYYQFNVLSIVEKWYDGISINNGFVIAAPQNQGSANTFHTFYSREGTYPPSLLILYEDPMSIDESSSEPNTIFLNQNCPNPFNPTTNIRFTLPKAGEVVLSVYNSLGQRVETLVSGRLSAGEHAVVWNAANQASGIYFCRLESGQRQRTIKMLLIK